MLLLCGASENELVSHHKNIQEGTGSWNLSAPRSCYAGSHRQSEDAERARRAEWGWRGGIYLAITPAARRVFAGRALLMNMWFSVVIMDAESPLKSLILSNK